LVEKFAANRHIERVEGILEAEIGVTLVDTTQKTVDAALVRVGEDEELDAGESLVAMKLEGVRLEDLDAAGMEFGRKLDGDRVERVEHRRHHQFLVGPERRSTELKVDGKIALVFEEGEDVDAVGGFPAVDVLAVEGEQHVTNADAVALAEAHRQALVGDFECDLQGKAECFFLFDSLIRVVALVNQPAGLVNDVRAVDRHRPTRSIHINGFLVIFLSFCFVFFSYCPTFM